MATSLRSHAASVLLAIAAVLPWLVWAPIAGAVALLLGVIALIGAFHGWGRAIGWIARARDASPLVAIQWGIAAVIAVGGVLIVARQYNPKILIIGGSALHSIFIAITFRARRETLGALLQSTTARYWVMPAVLLAAAGIVLVLAGAGSIGDRPFDEDGNTVAQVTRLVDTGTLGDAIGYPRISQLGGTRAIDGLIAGFAEPRMVRLLDELALVLLLALGCARIRPRDTETAIWSTLLIVTGSAFALAWPDRLPLWLPAGLLVTLVATFEDAGSSARAFVPMAVVTAALCVIRNEVAPAALAMLFGAWWSTRRPLREDATRLAVAAAILGCVGGSYLFVRMHAWSSVDAVAASLIEPRRGSVLVRGLLSAVIGIALYPLLLMLVPRTPALRWFAIACAAALGGVVGKLTSERIYGARETWILAAAAFVVLGADAARRRDLSQRAFVIVVAACLFVWEGRATAGRIGWSWRYIEMMYDVEYARHATPASDPFEAALASVPAGERVAVWVTQPERLDYARHEIIDLRTPRVARLRDPDPNDQRFERLLKSTRARWFLLERDAAYDARVQRSALYRLVCPPERRDAPECGDSLEATALRHPAVVETNYFRLVRVR